MSKKVQNNYQESSKNFQPKYQKLNNPENCIKSKFSTKRNRNNKKQLAFQNDYKYKEKLFYIFI